MFPGVLISGGSDYLPKADEKIRRVKELYWAIKNSLPRTLPTSFVKYLVGYAVERINICRASYVTLQTIHWDQD
jgi:hypothetical protein